MNYQTLVNHASDFFSVPENILYIIGAIAVIGAIGGIRRSLGRAGYSRHIGRRCL